MAARGLAVRFGPCVAHVADAAQAAELMLLLCAGRAAADTGNDGLAGVAADLLASAISVTALLGGQTLAKGLTGVKAMPTSLKRDLRVLDGAASLLRHPGSPAKVLSRLKEWKKQAMTSGSATDAAASDNGPPDAPAPPKLQSLPMAQDGDACGDEGASSAQLQDEECGDESGGENQVGDLNLDEAQKKAMLAMAMAAETLLGNSGGASTEAQRQAVQALRKWASDGSVEHSSTRVESLNSCLAVGGMGVPGCEHKMLISGECSSPCHKKASMDKQGNNHPKAPTPVSCSSGKQFGGPSSNEAKAGWVAGGRRKQRKSPDG